MMKNLDREAARQYILDGLDLRAFGSLAPRLPRIIGDMIEYDLHFRRLTGRTNPGSPSNTTRTRRLSTYTTPGWETIPARTTRT